MHLTVIEYFKTMWDHFQEFLRERVALIVDKILTMYGGEGVRLYMYMYKLDKYLLIFLFFKIIMMRNEKIFSLSYLEESL